MESKDTSKSRVVYLDVLNILAIIAVVAMHVNGIVHLDPMRKEWSSSLVVDCVFYFAVPVFFLISGATLMTYRERYDTKTFIKKRLVKILIPLLFWSMIMLIWKVETYQLRVDDYSFRNLFDMFLNNKIEYTYYFMYDIFGIYLTIPLLSLLAKEDNKKTLWFTVVIYFIFNSFLSNILTLMGTSYNNSLTVQIGEYIIFIILGYLLSTTDISKKKRIALYISAIIGVIYRYAFTYKLSKELGYVDRTTWGYCTWHSVLLACAVFVYFKNLKYKFSDKTLNLLKTISSCSFGIYLLHHIVMFYEIRLFNIDTFSWEWRTVGILTTYIISLICVYMLKKISIIKKIVP